MGSALPRKKRPVKYHATRQINPRRLSATSLTHFLRFSPALLRLRLLPGWVFVSLVVNGLLAVALLVLLFRYINVTTAASASAVTTSAVTAPEVTAPEVTAPEVTAPETKPHSVQANLVALSPLEDAPGQQHQLNYQQWQALLAKEATAVARQKPDRLTVLAGDSISLWFPVDLLPAQRTWLNQGISGETSEGLLKRLDLLDETEPEAIFIMIGINDLLRGATDKDILSSQREIVRYLQTAHPRSQIIIQSILPHASQAEATWEGRDRFSSLSNNRIQKLNRELETIAQEQGIYFLDLYPVFANQQGNLSMALSTDGLHLNAEGYHTWSIALQVYSREVLEPELTADRP